MNGGKLETIPEKDLLARKVLKFSKIPLGNVPIMLKSKCCVLNNMSKQVLYNMGECLYDQGGYFIVNGKEKVIVSQEKGSDNNIYI